MRVRIVPTSTTNITGFFHWMSGRSITNDPFKAVRAVGPSKRVFILLRRTWGLSVGEGAYGVFPLVFIPPFKAVTSVFISVFICLLPSSAAERYRPEMLRQGAERRHRQEQQGADYKNRTQEQERERRGVVP